jgi:hypothetical protein
MVPQCNRMLKYNIQLKITIQIVHVWLLFVNYCNHTNLYHGSLLYFLTIFLKNTHIRNHTPQISVNICTR